VKLNANRFDGEVLNTKADENLESTHITLEIPDSMADGRLDKVLSNLLDGYSRSQIQQWIKSGRVLVDNEFMRNRDKVAGGEHVVIEPELKSEPSWKPEQIPLDIVYEDKAVLVINKPAGLVVHPGAGNSDGTLLNALLYHDSTLQHLPRAGIVHRLDKDTSGIMVVARTEAARLNLIAQLETRTLHRQYQAVVQGLLVAGGSIDEPIGRHPVSRIKMAVSTRGKTAITHYHVVEKYRAHTLIDVRLETGRTHQIRVHIAHIQHPVVGDRVYGGRMNLPAGCSDPLIKALQQWKRQALHAHTLGFNHPDDDSFCTWSVEIPQDMQELILALKKDSASA
jgi:23S rRNA pseudouridine1911/1915/1917 synthase